VSEGEEKRKKNKPALMDAFLGISGKKKEAHHRRACRRLGESHETKVNRPALISNLAAVLRRGGGRKKTEASVKSRWDRGTGFSTARSREDERRRILSDKKRGD